jgi:hypothetical protein
MRAGISIKLHIYQELVYQEESKKAYLKRFEVALLQSW